jgi:hypothetical protein
MALYEAMQKSRLKPGSAVTPMESRPKPEPKPEPQVELELQADAAEVQSVDAMVDSAVEATADAAVAETAPVEEQTPASAAVRWQRPRRIQLNAGQLELTIPYPIVGAIILALILIILAAYRWGQSGVHTP